MYRLGLLGNNISYTMSPLVHGHIFAYMGAEGRYDVFDTDPANLKETVKRMKGELDGFNITKPYKQDIIAYIDEDRSGCGAVNTVSLADGKAVGYNTDGYGFMSSFNDLSPVSAGASVLVLGAGGAARTVVKELTAAGYKVYIANRTKEKTEELANTYNAQAFGGEKVDAVVNCTSVGLKKGESPLATLGDNLDLKKVKYAYDLIYAPPETDFLKAARAAGAAIKNGLDMLIYQAIRADEIILGTSFTPDDYREIAKLVKRL